MLAVGLVVAMACIPGAWMRSTHGNLTSGDEPHYLLTAASLAADGDLDVANQVADGRHRAFHEQGLAEQAAEMPDGRKVVPHDPLLAALLAGPMAVGGWLGARLALAVVAGLVAAMTLWLAVRRFGARLGPTVVAVVALSGSATMVMYGSQVYPELPAALAVLVGVAAATAPPQPAPQASGSGWLRWWSTGSRARADLGVVLAVVTLPWLAVKYVPVAATIAALHLWRRWQAGDRRIVGAVVAGYVVAGLAYVGLHVAWYGGVTVYAAGDFFREHGGQLSVLGTDPNLPGRVRRLVGLFVGRDFGIATWQPAWLLAAGAVAWTAARRRTNWDLVVAPVVVGWLNATFVAVTMQGWWFPGRQLVVVLPLAAVAVAVWASRVRWVRIGLVVAGLAGLVTTAWLVVDGLAGRVTVIVDFARTASPVLRALRAVSPDYLDVTAMTWAWHTAWLAVIVALAAAGWRGGRRARTGQASLRRLRTPRRWRVCDRVDA